MNIGPPHRLRAYLPIRLPLTRLLKYRQERLDAATWKAAGRLCHSWLLSTEQGGLSCRSAGARGAPRGLGHLSVPKRGFISQSLRWKGASWPVPTLLPPKVTDEQSPTENWSWRHKQLDDVQGRVSRAEIRLESEAVGFLGRSVDSDGDNAALLRRARWRWRWLKPGGQRGSGGCWWEPCLQLPPGGLTSKNKRPALNYTHALVLCPQMVVHFTHPLKNTNHHLLSAYARQGVGRQAQWLIAQALEADSSSCT